MTEPGLRQLTGVPTGLSSANDLGATAGPLIGTSQILLWDAGTEVNEEPGLGPNQAPLQPAPHTGTREQGEWRMIRNCRDSTVGFYLDTARFHWASAGAFTPSSISEPHRCEVRRAGAQRLRAGPRANAHLCELSATRFALRPWRKLRCLRAIGDRETVEFVRRQAGAAKHVTSVCTGAFILGVAGILKGRRATTHWAFTDLLPLVRATHEQGRVVRDGNVITAGGVTSEIDFGLTVAAEIAGETTAQTIQLGIEYNPAPPFDSGDPDRAQAAIKSALLSGRYNESGSAFRAGIESATRL